MNGPLCWLLCHRRYWRKRPLAVSMDWTKVRPFHTLMPTTVVSGRALPLLWETYGVGNLHKSRNCLQERLPQLLGASWVEVIAVVDRGFGRPELARTGQELGFHYVIRIRPKVYIEHREYRGRLEELPVVRGNFCCLPMCYFASQSR